MTASTRTIANALPTVGHHSSSMRRLAATLRRWRQRRRERRRERREMHELLRLAMIDPRTLADIGLSRSAAEFLVNKPFWRK